MADAPPTAPSTAHAGGDEPLEHVVDDEEPRAQALEWARVEILAGRVPEDLVAALARGGWDADEATLLVERVRRETRAERGVRTRDDVVREVYRLHGRTRRGALSAFPTLGAALRLFYSILTFRTLRGDRGAGGTSPRDDA